MGKLEKLTAVETAIRKALPRLMKPTEGCLFEDTLGINYEKLVNIDRSRDLYSFRLSTGELYTSKGYPKDNKIIGHCILLSDVLKWFDDLMLKSNEPVSLYDEFLGEQGIINIISLWDLSKPYLKDQSKELINFLYNLINI